LSDTSRLIEFRLVGGLPVWRFRLDGDVVLEKQLSLAEGRNTVYVRYRILGNGDRVRLKLRPALHFRNHHAAVSTPVPPCALTAVEHDIELRQASDLPALRLKLDGSRVAFTSEPARQGFLYRVERARGYDHAGELWSPGYFLADLTADRPVTLIASTESHEAI